MADKQFTFTKIATGAKSVTVAGIAEAIVASSIESRLVEIQALPGNTNNITVGDSNVVAAAGSERGITLVPGASVALRVKDLANIYIDAVTSGEGVGFVYFQN